MKDVGVNYFRDQLVSNNTICMMFAMHVLPAVIGDMLR